MAWKTDLVSSGVIASNDDKIIFASLPQNYFILEIFAALRSTYVGGPLDWARWTINGDTGANYQFQEETDTTTVTTGRTDAGYNCRFDMVASGGGVQTDECSYFRIQLLNYANATTYPLIRTVAYGVYANITGGIYKNQLVTHLVAAPITSLQFGTSHLAAGMGFGFVAGGYWELWGTKK